MTDEIRTEVAVVSGWVFQWRGDGWWRELSPGQYRDELAGHFEPSSADWVQWTGTFYAQARGDGWSPVEPSWWLLYGELPDATPVNVRLADGQQPPVTSLGGIWICEWVSPPQQAHVTSGTQAYTLRLDQRPGYLSTTD